MNTLACKRFGKGPNGTDIRLETADAEEQDCLKQARLWCASQVYNCISDAFGRFKRPKLECFDDPGPGCLTDLQCYNESCIPLFEKCYCTGLCAMQCTVCKPDPPPPPPPPGPPGTIHETDSHLGELGTNSCWGCPIPIPFGLVQLPGNIIWVGNVGIADVEVREVVGNVTNVTKTQFGYMDFALALGEGPIEAISRIWINDQLVINNSITLGDNNESSFNRAYYDLGMNVELIRGSEAQNVHQRMLLETEFGKVPAYRGLSYVMFASFPVFVSSTSMPSIKVEVITSIDDGVPIFNTISIGDAIPGYLDVDDSNKRAVVSNGTILKVIDLDNGSVVNQYTADTPILPTARVSPEGNMLFQTAADVMTFVRAFDHTEKGETTTPVYDFGRSIRLHDEAAQQVIHVVPLVRGRDITLFKIRGAL